MKDFRKGIIVGAIVASTLTLGVTNVIQKGLEESKVKKWDYTPDSQDNYLSDVMGTQNKETYKNEYLDVVEFTKFNLAICLARKYVEKEGEWPSQRWILKTVKLRTAKDQKEQEKVLKDLGLLEKGESLQNLSKEKPKPVKI